MLKKLFRKKLSALMMLAAIAVLAIPMSASAAPPPQNIDFSTGGSFTFSLSDIMLSAWSFIEQFNTYVILIMALIVVPTLVGFVIWLINKLPRFRKSAS